MILLPRTLLSRYKLWPQWIAVALLLLSISAAATALEKPTVDPALLSQLKQAAAEADSFNDQYDAEVWLVEKEPALARLVKDPVQRISLLKLIHSEASRAGLSPEIVLALIEVESHFDPYAVSSAGAQGMMQIMPFWKHEIGRPEDNLINLQTNLRYGCTILKCNEGELSINGSLCDVHLLGAMVITPEYAPFFQFVEI